jgi:hypothetical protein
LRDDLAAQVDRRAQSGGEGFRENIGKLLGRVTVKRQGRSEMARPSLRTRTEHWGGCGRAAMLGRAGCNADVLSCRLISRCGRRRNPFPPVGRVAFKIPCEIRQQNLT